MKNPSVYGYDLDPDEPIAMEDQYGYGLDAQGNRRKLGYAGHNSEYAQSDTVSDKYNEIAEPDMMDSAKPKTEASAGAGAAKGAAMSFASGGDASDIAAAAAMSSGNPYAIGAAMGLKVLSMQAQRKRKEKEVEYMAKNDRLQRQQQALEKLVGIGRGLREL